MSEVMSEVISELISEFISELISEVRKPRGAISRVEVTYLLRSNVSTTKFHGPPPKNVLRRSLQRSLRKSLQRSLRRWSPKWCPKWCPKWHFGDHFTDHFRDDLRSDLRSDVRSDLWNCTTKLPYNPQYKKSPFFLQLAEEAGIPPGVINCVTASRDGAGHVGKTLCESPLVGIVSFTGSTRVGKV